MAKIIQKVDMSTVEGRATFGDWLNEYTTANLLFDATTHMINVLSGMVKFQWGVIQDFSRAVIMMPKHRKMAVAQMRMANDMFIGQFQFFWFALKKAGANYKGLSPFNDEKTPSFVVSPAKEIWKDFSSGKGGNVVSFLMEHEQYTYPEALLFLAKKL